MSKIEIDRNTFRHALTNLTRLEVINILQSYNIRVDLKEKKEDIIEKLLKMLDDNEVTEELYTSIKGKAFSVNKNFYDGFFYKFEKNLCDFNLEQFLNELKNIANGEEKREVNINNPEIKDDNLYFTIEIISSRPIYDCDEDRSRYFKEKIDANISIYFSQGLIYVHSKNITENKKIKTFIQKVFNSKELNLDNKIKLVEPTFNTEISDKWIKNNTDIIGNKNYSTLTIHMLDMLEEFNNGKNNFSGLSLKNIYFKNDTIEASENEGSLIDELRYGGQNLQNHHKIKAELREGKKITGFKFEVQHMYTDEETEEKKESILPIVIIYEKKYALRISINTETVSAEMKILHQAYNDAKNIFMDKFKAQEILNTDQILDYLQDEECNNIKDTETTIDQKGWTFNG